MSVSGNRQIYHRSIKKAAAKKSRTIVKSHYFQSQPKSKKNVWRKSLHPALMRYYIPPNMVFNKQARSQPVFSGKPEGPFCLSCTFIFRNERNCMKKSARVSEKMVSPGLPGLQVATRLTRSLMHYSVARGITEHRSQIR